MARGSTLAVATCALVALVFIACSSVDDSSPTGSSSAGGTGGAGTGGMGGGTSGQAGVAGSAGSGTTGGSGGTGTAGAGGTGGSGGTGDSGGTGGSNFYQGGYVSLMQSIVTVSGTEYASYSFSASFSRGEVDTDGAACDIHEDGPCRVTDCISQTGVPTYETVGAGTIQLKGAFQPLSIVPDASGTYEVISGQERLWSGGETLTIIAAGGDVPAFQDTLVATAPVILTAPALPAPGTPVTLSTSGPLQLSWTGGTDGKVTAMLTRSDPGTPSHVVSLMCSFPASAGAGTVPASAMNVIPKGPDGSFQVLGGDMKTLEPGGWTITLQEYVPAVTPGGGTASALATYQ